MRRLIKGPEPTALVRNGSRWKCELQNAKVAGDSTSIQRAMKRYAHRDIRAAVIAETDGKCLYCESKVSHVSPGDIEHIVPKSISEEFCFDWSNLSFSCSICNNCKNDYYSVDDPLINPYVENPEDHLCFVAGFVFPRNASRKGARTLATLSLNRMDLVERRNERLASVARLVLVWQGMKEGYNKELAWSEIMNEIGSDKEYSRAVAALVRESSGQAIAM